MSKTMLLVKEEWFKDNSAKPIKNIFSVKGLWNHGMFPLHESITWDVYVAAHGSNRL